MKKSNYIFIPIGFIFFIVGILIEHNRSIFNDVESAGYFGHTLFVLSIFIIMLQLFIWFLKILILVLKEIWEQINDK